MKRIFPCKCGHVKSFHRKVKAPIWENYCVGERKHKKYNLIYPCMCDGFKPDNLTYLAQMYKESKKKRKAKK